MSGQDEQEQDLSRRLYSAMRRMRQLDGYEMGPSEKVFVKADNQKVKASEQKPEEGPLLEELHELKEENERELQRKEDSFERDFTRYLICKRRDALMALSQMERVELLTLLAKVDKYCMDQGKPPLICVVVESGWPEYETVWRMIECRVRRDKE